MKKTRTEENKYLSDYMKDNGIEKGGTFSYKDIEQAFLTGFKVGGKAKQESMFASCDEWLVVVFKDKKSDKEYVMNRLVRS